MEDTDSRFWAKVDKSGECWLWTGLVVGGGYGQLRRGGSRYYAHRYSYQLHHGVTPRVLLHKCDVRRCVNPAHLQGGTHQLNSLDAGQKGRGAGQKVGLQARQQMRALYGTGDWTQKALGIRYGITQGVVSGIINNKVGSHDHERITS